MFTGNRMFYSIWIIEIEKNKFVLKMNVLEKKELLSGVSETEQKRISLIRTFSSEQNRNIPR